MRRPDDTSCPRLHRRTVPRVVAESPALGVGERGVDQDTPAPVPQPGTWVQFMGLRRRKRAARRAGNRKLGKDDVGYAPACLWL